MRHTLDPKARHYAWDRNLVQALEIDSGDEVAFPIGFPPLGDSGHETVARPPGFSMPLSGPVWVKGARPGDVLEVSILEVLPERSGYTSISPGFGLLSDTFPGTYRHEWDLSDPHRATFKEGIVIPIAPFLGIIGVAPDSSEPLETIPPGRHGGNLDIRHLTVGATLWLPVQVEGGKLSAGDMHAAQGDGEVCGTAIETWGRAVLGITLRRDLAIHNPQFRTLGPMDTDQGESGWHCTVGIGPDLKEAAVDAIKDMIAYLGHHHHLRDDEAYALCSVAVDLRIAEIVDRPNWVVTACLPMSIFASGTSA